MRRMTWYIYITFCMELQKHQYILINLITVDINLIIQEGKVKEHELLSEEEVEDENEEVKLSHQVVTSACKNC